MSQDALALTTVAEQSGFLETGRTDEVGRLAHAGCPQHHRRPGAVDRPAWRGMAGAGARSQERCHPVRCSFPEPYVADQIAVETLEEDPSLAAQFQARLDGEPDFASNPSARLEFFMRRHASWDEQFNLHPIYRL